METNVEKEFRPEAFTQTGIRSESVKRTKTKGSMSTIDTMATKTEQRAIKSQTITLSSKVHRTKRLYPTKRQTKSQRSESYTNKCPCQISIILHSDSYFYLDVQYTDLHHTGHPPIPPRANHWDLQKFQMIKHSFSNNYQSWVSKNPKYPVFWVPWKKARVTFQFKLWKTT